MNRKAYYTRQNEVWEDQEFQMIKTEYVEKQLTISEIADIHKRTPGSIAYKVKAHGLIDKNAMARGYDEYKQSALYKEIIETGRIGEKTKKKANESLFSKKKTQAEEIQELKAEVQSLKQDVKEMLRLIQSIYEFENQETN